MGSGSGPAAHPGLRNWYDNPGGDGSWWVLPFQTGAANQWTRSGSMIDTLRGHGASSHLGSTGNTNWAKPWVIGKASDPLVTVTDDAGHSIQIRIPIGTVSENEGAGDNSMGGADSTKPYLVWTANNAVINTGSIQASGSSIHASYLGIFDGAGPVMMDAYTNNGWGTSDNALGVISMYDLAAWPCR